MPLAAPVALAVMVTATTASSPSSAEEGETAFEIAYTGEVFRNFDGGIARGTRYMDNLDVTLEHVRPSFGSEESTFLIYGLYNNNTGFSEDLVGDAQVLSNIDNSRNFRLYELWYNQTFNDGRGSFKVGLIDLNSEFYVIDTAGLFLNSSHGIGPDFSQTGENGPSIFPSTSLAARIDYAVTDKFTVRFGVFDSVPGDPDHPARNVIKLNEGALLVAEVDYRSDDLRVAGGVFYYTDDFDPVLGGPAVARQRGMYVLIEGSLIKEADGEGQGLSAFLRVGVANPDLNQLGSYIGIGAVYTGLFNGRDQDQFGVALAMARNGDDFNTSLTNAGIPRGPETNLEVSYYIQVNDWLSLQPDIQYIINPGGTGELENAFVGGVRFSISYAR